MSGCVRCGFTPHVHPDAQGTLTTGPPQRFANEHEALRLVGTATEVARRLQVVCADWPEERFGALVYEAALARLGGELSPDAAARLRRGYETHREMYLARLREVAD